jgi:hypothetical protein
MFKKKSFTCKECVFCLLAETDKSNEAFAPCLANPPTVIYDPTEKRWLSSRPYTNVNSPCCRFGKRNK